VTFLTTRTSTGNKVDVFHQSQPLTQSSDVTHAVRVVKNVTCLSSRLSHKDEDSRVELILDNLTFNFNSLLGIVYVSLSMQFPTVEECNFDRLFLFDDYVAISHRYDRGGSTQN
jgi:hypothetical protein